MSIKNIFVLFIFVFKIVWKSVKNMSFNLLLQVKGDIPYLIFFFLSQPAHQTQFIYHSSVRFLCIFNSVVLSRNLIRISRIAFLIHSNSLICYIYIYSYCTRQILHFNILIVGTVFSSISFNTQIDMNTACN